MIWVSVEKIQRRCSLLLTYEEVHFPRCYVHGAKFPEVARGTEAPMRSVATFATATTRAIQDLAPPRRNLFKVKWSHVHLVWI